MQHFVYYGGTAYNIVKTPILDETKLRESFSL